MNGQAIIIILLGLVVAKLYPDWWGAVLLSFGCAAIFSITRHGLKNTTTWLTTFPFRESIKVLPGYLAGLTFALVVLFSSVAIPLRLATIVGLPFQFGFVVAVVSMSAFLVFLWKR